jgi:recombination associated protein RdgC
MGALKGSVTVRRYRVRGDKPKELSRLVKGVRAHVFLPIDPKTDVERQHGWAAIHDADDTELDSANIFFDGRICLSLREDVLRPPTAVVKRLMAEKLKPLGRRPSKNETSQAKTEVIKSLRGRYLPVTKTWDLVWNLDEGTLLFWSHAKRTNDLMIEAFHKSFGLELVSNGPGRVVPRGVPKDLQPTPEMLFGFPGMPGRATENEEMTDVA